MTRRPRAPRPARAAIEQPRMLRVLSELENPAGGVWPIGSVIPFDALRPEAITILMQRQIVMVYLSPEDIAAPPVC